MTDFEKELADVKRELSTVRRQLEEANAESASRKGKLLKMREELAEVKGEAEKIRTERSQEVEAALGKAREVVHKTAFERIAKGLGANDLAINDLFNASGYKADLDDVDEAALTTLINQTLENKPYFRAQVEEAKTEPKPALSPGQGLGRGSLIGSGTVARFTKSEVRTIGRSSRKQEYMDAMKSGNYEIIPD